MIPKIHRYNIDYGDFDESIKIFKSRNVIECKEIYSKVTFRFGMIFKDYVDHHVGKFVTLVSKDKTKLALKMFKMCVDLKKYLRSQEMVAEILDLLRMLFILKIEWTMIQEMS